MPLQLKKPLVFFDLETTGLNFVSDRIIEIAMLKLTPENVTTQLELYPKNNMGEPVRNFINPGIPIPPASSNIHKIYDKDVVNMPKFKDVAPKIIEFMGDADLAGFNCIHFDIPMLQEALLANDFEIDLTQRNFVDVQKIFHAKEPRNLAAAFKFYCNAELKDAHSAKADNDATYEILLKQIDKYKDIGNDVDTIIKATKQGHDSIDLDRKMKWDDKKNIVFSFGKYKDQPVKRIFKKDKSYYDWLMGANFCLETKEKFKKIYNKIYSNQQQKLF